MVLILYLMGMNTMFLQSQNIQNEIISKCSSCSLKIFSDDRFHLVIVSIVCLVVVIVMNGSLSCLCK